MAKLFSEYYPDRDVLLDLPRNSSGLGSAIVDSNGNEELVFVQTASAVNELQITNAATGNNPELAVTGDDTNVSFQLSGKGTGLILVGDSGTGTEASGSVTVNAQRGVITTSSLSTAAGLVNSFDLENNKISANSQLLLSLVRGGNTQGSPVLQDASIDTAGSATIRILNASQSEALSGSALVHFLVLS